MIIRRFSEHIGKQNWFAVGLDLIVVVVGIYIGLQADAFMSAKQDRDLEIEYLERLLTDMDESIVAQKSNLKAFDDGTSAIDYAANITSWILGWSKYHGAVLMNHHKDTIEFRDLLNEKLSKLR